MTFLNPKFIFYECCLHQIIMIPIQISIKKSISDSYSSSIDKHQILLFYHIHGWKTTLTQDFVHNYYLFMNTSLFLCPIDVWMVLI